MPETIFAKVGEKTPVHFDPAVVKAGTYGSFNGTDAPTATAFGAMSVILQDNAAEYQLEGVATTYAVPVIGSVFPAGTTLEARAHRAAGNEAWAALTVSEDGRTINTTIAVAANTGWAIQIRSKVSQIVLATSTTFDVLAAP